MNRLARKLAGIAITAALAVPAIVIAVEGPAKPTSIGSPAHPLRPLQRCLDPGAVVSWQALGNDAMLVETMRGRFLLHLVPACTGLLASPSVRFRAPFSGMLCGSSGEAVVARGEACPIVGIERLGKARYETLLRGKRESAPAPATSDRGNHP